MAKKNDGHRIYNVAVVGLSGTEKGDTGIGKSCLCNRFMRPLADDYFTDHISVLSQSDFVGRVVNNDHFLYWGEVTKNEEGVDYTFQVIEQTEFIDDSSFQPFKSSKTESYIKRCASLKLQSAEKLMYICKNQLGVEHEFKEKLLPEGKISIDGFLCLFDVSQVPNRRTDIQMEHVSQILSVLVKTKKPVVMVSSKNDEQEINLTRRLELLLGRKEYKGNIPIVETSAHLNVNVDHAFLCLAHLIDKAKNRPKVLAFSEASKSQLERQEVAKDAYMNLLRTCVSDYRDHWMTVHKTIRTHPDYGHFVDLLGTEKARKLFQKHCRELREEHIRNRKNKYLEKLRLCLRDILPDLETIQDRGWHNLRQLWLPQQPYFDEYFVRVPDDMPWERSQIIESKEERIPVDLLDSQEAENEFLNHLNALRQEARRAEYKRQFRQLLQKHTSFPGMSLSDVTIFFIGHDCFSALTEDDKNTVYQEHQRELREAAKEQFLELLLEHGRLFEKYRRKNLNNNDIKLIEDELRADSRYQALNNLSDDRRSIIISHHAFIKHPSKEKCPFRDNCVDSLLENILSKVHRRQSWSENSSLLLDCNDSLNLVLLGSDELASHLEKEMEELYKNNEYSTGDKSFQLSYRIIQENVQLPENSFKTPQFTPHGCFCVFNSETSLQFLQNSLQNTLLSDRNLDNRVPFQGLPAVIMLGHNAGITDKELEYLRDQGQTLANSLQCPFIDIPSSLFVEGSTIKYHEDQIEMAMKNLAQSIIYRFCSPPQIAESIEPDLRVLMLYSCGDDFSIEVSLTPLLSHHGNFVTQIDEFPTITLEAHLDSESRKVEVTLASYHGGFCVKDELFHGYVLVYLSKRKASLASLETFCMKVPNGVPTQIVAITSDTGNTTTHYHSREERGLIKQGSNWADRLSEATFIANPLDVQQNSSSFSEFFRKCWEKKSKTESMHPLSAEDCDRMFNRPPATLPYQHRHHDSFINNSDDSDHIYDRPHLYHCQSDSDPDRPSSTSPTPQMSYTNDVYSEINHDNHLNASQSMKHRKHDYDRKGARIPKPGHLDPHKLKQGKQKLTSSGYPAPLATPEPVEMGDYAQVRDAIQFEPPAENEYAVVADILPQGKMQRIKSTHKKQYNATLPSGVGSGAYSTAHTRTGSESDSEHSASEADNRAKDDIYSRVNRRPTPHKKKHKPRGAIEGPVPLMENTEERQLLLYQDHLDKLRSNSPSDGSEGTGDENNKTKKPALKKKKSFRGKKKKSVDQDVVPLISSQQPQWMDDGSSMAVNEDDSSYDLNSSGRFDDGDELDTSGNKSKKFGFWPAEKDPEKQKRKEEKRVKEEEKRKLKEEKKQREKEEKKRKGVVKAKGENAITLESLVASDLDPIPPFVRLCVEFIQEDNLETEGLYRVPGNSIHVNQLREKFKEDGTVDIKGLDIPVNAVATALKGFFNDLESPLVPFSIHDDLCRVLEEPTSDRNQYYAVRDILHRMPYVNLQVLHYIVTHMNRVSKHSSVNKMDSRNLATCLWPTLMRPDFTSLETMSLKQKHFEDILQLLIENPAFFFSTYET